MNMRISIIPTILLSIILVSCGEDKQEKQKLVYEIFFENFFSKSNLEYISTQSGATIITQKNYESETDPFAFYIEERSSGSCQFLVTNEKYFPESKAFAAVIEPGNPFSNGTLDANLVDFAHAEISQNAYGMTTVELPVSKGAIADEVVERMGSKSRWIQTVITGATFGPNDKEQANQAAKAWKEKVELFKSKYCKSKQ